MKRETLGNVVNISKGKKHSTAEIPDEFSKRIIGIDDLRNDDNIRFTNAENDSIEGKELGNYEIVKGIVYKLLDGTNPFLNQILSHDKDEGKKIYLERTL